MRLGGREERGREGGRRRKYPSISLTEYQPGIHSKVIIRQVGTLSLATKIVFTGLALVLTVHRLE